MSKLEKVVRPFQLTTTARPRRIPIDQQEPSKSVTLQIGRGGSGRSYNGSLSSQRSAYCEAYQVEERPG